MRNDCGSSGGGYDSDSEHELNGQDVCACLTSLTFVFKRRWSMGPVGKFDNIICGVFPIGEFAAF